MWSVAHMKVRQWEQLPENWEELTIGRPHDNLQETSHRKKATFVWRMQRHLLMSVKYRQMSFYLMKVIQ